MKSFGEGKAIAILTNRVVDGIDRVVESFIESATSDLDREIRTLLKSEADGRLNDVTVETNKDEYVIRIKRPFTEQS